MKHFNRDWKLKFCLMWLPTSHRVYFVSVDRQRVATNQNLSVWIDSFVFSHDSLVLDRLSLISIKHNFLWWSFYRPPKRFACGRHQWRSRVSGWNEHFSSRQLSKWKNCRPIQPRQFQHHCSIPQHPSHFWSGGSNKFCAQSTEDKGKFRSLSAMTSLPFPAGIQCRSFYIVSQLNITIHW